MNDFGAPWVKVSAAKLGILANTKFVGVTIEATSTGLTLSTRARSALRSFTSRPRRPPLM